ncbi:MAG: leucine-rich repeat protein, partial [Clostridia bacterium]|nr:leucine-rich repeat protein [Clostridia bacterium]
YKKSSDYKTENDKLVMVASLIGNTNDWSNNKQNLVYRMHQIGLLLKGTTYSDLDGKSIYQKVYDYYARKSLFSGEIYDKAVPYIDSVVYEYLYAYSVLMECMEASLKVSRFTPEDEASLSAKVSEEYRKLKSNSGSVIEDEIGTEALMMFNFHDEKSLISQYSNFIYNAENSRFTYLDKGNTKIAVKPILGSKETGRESDVNEIEVIEDGGSNNTRAHEIYNNGIYRYQNALDGIQFISSAKLGEMGTYVSENYQSTKSVWDFLSDRGFDLGVTDSNTTMLVTNAKVKQWGKTNSSNIWGEYNKDQYQGYTGFVYNNESLTPKDVLLYTLNHRKVQDSLAYQAIAYNHYYRSYAPDTIKTKPLKIFYFEQDTFHNVSTFSYDSKINSVIVNAKATGATGRQTVKVQYRQDSDDAWTTSYAPSSVIPLERGYTYEFRTVISDEAGHKETTDTFYVESPTFVEAKEPYIDSDGDYHLGNVAYFSNKGKYYAVNEDGSMGEELSDVTLSYFEFRPLDDGTYQVRYYTGSYESLENNSLILPKTFEGKKITVIGDGRDGFIRAYGRTKYVNIILNENITKIQSAAFRNAMLRKVQGNTSGLSVICSDAFTGAKTSDGYLSINLDYPGEVRVDPDAFNQNARVIFDLKHQTTLSRDNAGEGKRQYYFTDAHPYGEPIWDWSDDHSSAKATFTCTDSRCKHQEIVSATVTKNGLRYEAKVVFEGKTYTNVYNIPHTHTYGEPTWTWSDDCSRAKATFTCTDPDCGHEEIVGAVVTTTDNDGKPTYTATVEFNGQTYTDTKTVGYVPRTEPYIDSTGAYIPGIIEHYEFEGKNFAKNANGSIGEELSDITFSYFDFDLLDDNTYRIIRYKGTYEALTNDELVIPKTYNGKKITVIGDGRDNFIHAQGKIKYVHLVLNENITKIESIAFRYAMLRRVQGNTSGLLAIGSDAFYGAKTFDGYLSIKLDYPGEVQVDAGAFSQITRVVFTLKHQTTISRENAGEGRRQYIFTDAHIYGEPTWSWSDDHSKANVSLTCIDERCQHKENRNANVVKTEETDNIIYTATVEFGGKTYTDTYTEAKDHIHAYGEPAWTWSEDHTSAKAIFNCTDNDDTQTVDAEVTKTEETDKIIYTATVEFGGKTYTDTYTEKKEEVPVYYPAAKPYIDDEGEYILGYKEHYRYKGKYYAVNSDKSVGEEVTDIWISYFRFALLPNDTYAIEYYTGATKDLTEIVIPKTYKHKKVTTLGTDNLDVFIKGGKPQFELVLNENIAEIKSCAFNKIGVTKVSGDSSGLCKIGEYAFSWVNKTGGYALDITFAYPGVITTGDAIFNHVNATLRLGHGTTFSNTDFRAASVKYIFDDSHTYGEPTWEWADDRSSAKAIFTCTDPRCDHTETIDAIVSPKEGEEFAEYTAKAVFNGVVYSNIRAAAWSAFELEIIDSGKSGEITIPEPNSTPKTGDTSSAAAAAAILLTSLTAALLLAMKRRKDEEA